MWKKTLTLAVLGIASAMPLLAAGCASSSEKPNAVTGQEASPALDRAAYDQWGRYHPEWVGKPELNPSFYDSKHHYHPEWAYNYTH